MSSSGNKKVVLVIGGGIAGCTAIVGLRKRDKEVEIVLVEPKDHMEIFWATYRTPFDEDVAKDSLLSLQEWTEKHNVKHVRSVVTKLNKKSAALQNGETVNYDVCLVAVGAGAKAPFLGRGIPASNDGKNSSTADRQGRLSFLKEQGDAMMNAKSVVIIGGGLIGTELAGDLVDQAKKNNKEGKSPKVTLVHAGSHLCPELNEPAARRAKTMLEKKGIRVILDDKAIESKGESPDKMVLASSGEALDADLVVWTNGLTPVAPWFMKEGDFADALDERGWLETDEYMRIKGSATEGRVFAFGDCSTLLPKAASQLFVQMKNIGNNLKVALDHPDDPKAAEKCLKKAAPGPQVFVVTTGPTSGVAYIKGMFHTTWLLPGMKNKSMFFFKVKDELQM